MLLLLLSVFVSEIVFSFTLNCVLSMLVEIISGFIVVLFKLCLSFTPDVLTVCVVLDKVPLDALRFTVVIGAAVLATCSVLLPSVLEGGERVDVIARIPLEKGTVLFKSSSESCVMFLASVFVSEMVFSVTLMRLWPMLVEVMFGFIVVLFNACLSFIPDALTVCVVLDNVSLDALTLLPL